MWRSFALFALAWLCLGLGVGCEGGASSPYFGTTDRHGRDPATLYLNGNDEPETLDPGLCSDRAATTLIAELFEGLVVLHPDDLHPTAGVAVRWDQSADNRHFRFELRRDARWSDGAPVTAHDFVYAWRRVLSPKLGARMATILYPLRNAKAFHEGRLSRLRQPSALRRAPAADETVGAPLGAGAPIRLLMADTVEIKGSVPPLGAPPAGEELRFRGKPKGGGGADLLEVVGSSVAVRGEAGSSVAGSRAQVLGHGPAVRCNGGPDRWYRLRVGDVEGFLPGCALTPRWAGAAAFLVTPHEERPTFGRKAREPASPAPAPPAPSPSTTPVPTAAARSAPAGEPATPTPAEEAIGWLAASQVEPDPDALGVRAVDDYTLEVELTEPTPYFLELLSYPTTFPVRADLIARAEAAGEPDRWTRPGQIVGNGPFALESWTFRYEITMTRNPYHRDHDRLRVHRVVWVLVPQHHATMNLYRTGELDYIGPHVSLPSAYLERLSRYRDFVRSKYLATYWLELNVTKPPLDDVRVRRALNLAIDKRQLVDAIKRSELEPATHFVPDFTGSGYSAAAEADRSSGRDPFHGPGLDFDPRASRTLLRDAGYRVEERADGVHTAGFPALELLYNTGEGHQQIAVMIQAMWRRELGISVGLRSEEWKVMLQNIREGNFQAARFGWTADYNHPHTWLDTFLSYSAQNWTRWKSPTFDGLVERAAATADRAASIGLYRQAERLAVDEMPRIPIYFYAKSTLIKPYVKGFYPNPKNEHPLRFLWIDPRWSTEPDNAPAFEPEEFPPPGRLPS